MPLPQLAPLNELVQVNGLAVPEDFNKLLDWVRFLADPPGVAVRLTATQQVNNSVDHTISWHEATWDSTGGDMWNAGGPSKILITRPGVYLFQLSKLWQASTQGGKRAAFLHVNGTRRRGDQPTATDADPFESSPSWVTNLAAGDECDIMARQLTGGALNLEPHRTVLTVMWLRLPPGAFVA